MNAPKLDILLSPSQISAICGVDPDTVRGWIRQSPNRLYSFRNRSRTKQGRIRIKPRGVILFLKHRPQIGKRYLQRMIDWVGEKALTPGKEDVAKAYKAHQNQILSTYLSICRSVLWNWPLINVCKESLDYWKASFKKTSRDSHWANYFTDRERNIYKTALAQRIIEENPSLPLAIRKGLAQRFNISINQEILSGQQRSRFQKSVQRPIYIPSHYKAQLFSRWGKLHTALKNTQTAQQFMRIKRKRSRTHTTPLFERCLEFIDREANKLKYDNEFIKPMLRKKFFLHKAIPQKYAVKHKISRYECCKRLETKRSILVQKEIEKRTRKAIIKQEKMGKQLLFKKQRMRKWDFNPFFPPREKRGKARIAYRFLKDLENELLIDLLITYPSIQIKLWNIPKEADSTISDINIIDENFFYKIHGGNPTCVYKNETVINELKKFNLATSYKRIDLYKKYLMARHQSTGTKQDDAIISE